MLSFFQLEIIIISFPEPSLARQGLGQEEDKEIYTIVEQIGSSQLETSVSPFTGTLVVENVCKNDL